MKGYLAELCQSGSAVFFSTHVLEVAEKLCHTIAIIREGRLVAEGATAELDIENKFFDYYEGRTAQ